MFNEYFLSIAQKLGIVIEKSNIKLTELQLEKINLAIIKRKNHTSIKTIKSKMVELSNPTFSFDFISVKK